MFGNEMFKEMSIEPLSAKTYAMFGLPSNITIRQYCFLLFFVGV